MQLPLSQQRHPGRTCEYTSNVNAAVVCPSLVDQAIHIHGPSKLRDEDEIYSFRPMNPVIRCEPNEHFRFPQPDRRGLCSLCK